MTPLHEHHEATGGHTSGHDAARPGPAGSSGKERGTKASAGADQSTAPEHGTGRPRRLLPEHIAAQLRSAGGPTDTGGQPWAGRNLGEGTSHTHQYPGDDGLTPPAVSQAFERFSAGLLPEEAVVQALAGQRLFAPVLAQISQTHLTEDGLVSDKESEMALVSIQAPDGRKALPVFTSVDRLTGWHPEARPVAAEARRIALSAVEDENQLLVVDPGAELTFVVRRPALWALAKGERWLPSYADPQVQQRLEACAAGIEAIREVTTAPGRGIAARNAAGEVLAGGGPGPELSVSLGLRPGLSREMLEHTVEAFRAAVAEDPHLADSVDSLDLALRAV